MGHHAPIDLNVKVVGFSEKVYAAAMFKIILLFTSFLTFISGGTAIAAQKAKAMTDKNFYDFSLKDINGEDLKLSSYKGKIVLVVNTASRCGFTHQYEGLQKLYDAYQDKGLVVLGIPSNDFLSQEPGTNAEIKKFCETKFGITFPMTEKVHVKGADTDPLYLWLLAQPGGETPGWNFHKFLIGKDGKLLRSFDSKVEPDDKGLLSAIDAAIAAQ